MILMNLLEIRLIMENFFIIGAVVSSCAAIVSLIIRWRRQKKSSLKGQDLLDTFIVLATIAAIIFIAVALIINIASLPPGPNIDPGEILKP